MQAQMVRQARDVLTAVAKSEVPAEVQVLAPVSYTHLTLPTILLV